jgi:hypothetical protein
MKWIVFTGLTIVLLILAVNMTGTVSYKLPTQEELEREIYVKDSLHAEIQLRMDILKYRYSQLNN